MCRIAISRRQRPSGRPGASSGRGLSAAPEIRCFRAQGPPPRSLPASWARSHPGGGAIDRRQSKWSGERRFPGRLESSYRPRHWSRSRPRCWAREFNDQDRIGDDRFLGLILRADHRQIRDPDIMFRPDPGHHARIREHAAQARPLREMVRDKPAKFRLYGTMGPARGRHRLRRAVHELPKPAIPRVPNKKFRDGHPDRDLGNRTHDFRLAQKDGRPNQPAADVSLSNRDKAWPLSVRSRRDCAIDQVKLLQGDNIVSPQAEAEGRTLRGLGIAPEPFETLVPSYLYRYRKTGQFAGTRAV